MKLILLHILQQFARCWKNLFSSTSGSEVSGDRPWRSWVGHCVANLLLYRWSWWPVLGAEPFNMRFWALHEWSKAVVIIELCYINRQILPYLTTQFMEAFVASHYKDTDTWYVGLQILILLTYSLTCCHMVSFSLVGSEPRLPLLLRLWELAGTALESLWVHFWRRFQVAVSVFWVKRTTASVLKTHSEFMSNKCLFCMSGQLFEWYVSSSFDSELYTLHLDLLEFILSAPYLHSY